MLRPLLSRILGTFRRQRLDREFDEGLQQHLELLKERFVRSGLDPSAAFNAARRQFGGITQMREDLWERRALAPWDGLARDARHAFRQLRKAKWFAGSAALTLALGVGASAAYSPSSTRLCWSRCRMRSRAG
jgi:hypothetical protein